MKALLSKIGYNKFKFWAIGDFKVISLRTGLQLGNTKYSCFSCKWDSRATADPNKIQFWEPRDSNEIGSLNQKFPSLVPKSKILLPHLHINLGLPKKFIKNLPKHSAAISYLRKQFPQLSEAKLCGGIVIGPQIRKLYVINCMHGSYSKIFPKIS